MYGKANATYSVYIDAFGAGLSTPDTDIVTWSTSNSNIAKPVADNDETGCYSKVDITTVNAGKAVITGVFKNSGKKIAITVYVGDEVAAETAITLNKKKTLTVYDNKGYKLAVASNAPKSTAIKSIEWTN